MLRKILLLAVVFFFAVSLHAATTKVIAHRGASSVAPENTLAAFSKAVDFHSDYFELDVRVSSDDSLMLMHDETVDRTTDGSGRIDTMSYRQLRQYDAGSWFGQNFTGEKIPTLAEALDLALNSPYPVGVVIEIKAVTPTIVGKVVALVQNRHMQNRVIISSFNFAQIAEAKSIDPSIPVQLFSGNIGQANINQVAGIKGEWVGTGGTANQALLDSAHVKGILLNKWTVNSASEMRTFIDLGVDGLTTNFPQTVRALMDSTPPPDVHLNDAEVNVTKIKLSWTGVEDAESGIAGYEIYRDTQPGASVLLATVGDAASYWDETHKEATPFYYRVKAKNGAGLTSLNFSNEILATTGLDQDPPGIGFITSFGRVDRVVVEFNERVEKASAEDSANYLIDLGVTVHQARLAIDSVSVILTTSALAENTAYTLSVSGVKDRAATPNAIVAPIEVSFTYKNFLPQTAAAWFFDEGEGATVFDASGNANDGTLFSGVGWSAGQSANGLIFDGVDDYVTIPQSASLDIGGAAVTVCVWTKLAILPAELPGGFGPIYDSDTDNYVIYEDKSNNELRFKVSTTAGAERPGIPAADLVTGEWLHVAGVYDGSKAVIYLNGVAKDSHPLTGNVKTGQVAILGKSAGSFFKGSIDNAQVFDRALSEDEIRFLYKEAKTPNIDTVPPEIVQVFSRGSDNKVFVEFSEQVNETSAETVGNYAIDNGVTVGSVQLALDGKTVILTTSTLTGQVLYTLIASNIQDRAEIPNIIAPNTSQAFSHQGFPAGLVSFWDLDEESDTTAYDGGVHANHAHVRNGAQWMPGKTGNALGFDGVDDYAEIPNSPSLDIDTTGVTVSLWVNLKYLPADMPFSIGPIYDSRTDNYVIYEDKGNKELRFKVTTTAGAERPGIPAQDLQVDTWLHVAGVFDGSSAKIYLNGELKDKHTLGGKVNPGQIARLGQDGPWYFAGQIDNVQVYDRGLSEQEVKFLYSGKTTPRLIVEAVDETAVTLAWEYDYDPVAGVSGYHIYRDTTAAPSAVLAAVEDTTKFTDETKQEFTRFYYRLKAVDVSGVESEYFSNEVLATTAADVTPPELASVLTSGENTKVLVRFTEQVSHSSAENIANYAIDKPIQVNAVRLALDSSSVILSVSELTADEDYTITVNNVADRAATPNVIASGTTQPFTFFALPDNIVSYWPLDEGQDTTASDVTGNNNTGTLRNQPAWAGGKLGNALSFNGLDDYVDIPASPSLNIQTAGVTLALWVKLEYLPTLMPIGIGPIYDAAEDRYVLYEDRGNKELRFKVTTGSGAERPGIPESSLETGKWLHVAGVYNGSHAMIYLNGKLMDTHNLTGNVRPDQVARLGRDGANYFKGAIDNVQVYDRGLTAEEVEFLYSGKKEPGTGVKGNDEVPLTYHLSQNYPNPFNPATKIKYSLRAPGRVKIELYNTIGQKVRTLVDEVKAAGIYTLEVAAVNLPTGIYFYRISAGDFVQTRKMVLMK